MQKVSDIERIKLQCEEFEIDYRFYCLVADKNIRKERVVKRNEGTGDTFSFSVSPEMFEITNRMFEKPREDELVYTEYVDTGQMT